MLKNRTQPGLRYFPAVRATYGRSFSAKLLRPRQTTWVPCTPPDRAGWRFVLRGFRGVNSGSVRRNIAKYKIEEKWFYIGWISNGRISAFRIAEDYSERFCLHAVFPGLPANDRDFECLNVIGDMSMLLMVGERDKCLVGWM